MIPDWWMALSIGLLGSLHCVGMCGPIALMVPGQGGGFWAPTLLYHAGKTMAYGLVGIFIGLVGQGIAFAGMQSWMSVLMGVSILGVVLLSVPVEQRVLQIPTLKRFYSRIQMYLSDVLRKDPARAGFSIGFLNGFIPCGLVYLAVAGAIAMGTWWQGGLFMIFFGLGTMPALLATAFFSKKIPTGLRQRINRWMPVFLILIALIFIWRGLQVHFPVELRFWEMKDQPMMCH